MQAYNLMNWNFLQLLEALIFRQLVRWLDYPMHCTPRFSVDVNGELMDFILSSRGSEQHPISPFLFFP